MNIWRHTKEELEEEFDSAKLVILQALVADKLIDYKIANTWACRNTIIIKTKGFFRSLSTTWEKETTNDDKYIMLRVSRKEDHEKSLKS